MNLRASSSHALYALFACLGTIASAAADDAASAIGAPDTGPARMETMTIIGNPNSIDRIGGSAQYLSHDELDTFRYADVMRVLRAVPGVYLQDEEGFGLRPNIGIRGSGLDRSSRIALLEDGVLIAPAPYSSPSAYYFPTQRRMSSLEVLKGPASVVVGPRTTGGALNMISTPIPASSRAVRRPAGIWAISAPVPTKITSSAPAAARRVSLSSYPPQAVTPVGRTARGPSWAVPPTRKKPGP